MAQLKNSSLDVTAAGNGSEIVTIGRSRLENSTTSLNLLFLPLIISLLGMGGNVIVFRCLFFNMRRTQSTVYILNLAMADLAFLIGSSVILGLLLCAANGVTASREVNVIVMFIGGLLYNFGFNASSFLLTAISVERCLSVLFPIWNRCHRPKHQSAIVCLLLWTLSVVVLGLENFLGRQSKSYQEPESETRTTVYFFTSALYLLMVLLMVLSCLVLLIEIRKSSKQCQPPKLYIVIMLTVVVFLVSVVPARVLGLLLYFNVLDVKAYTVGFFCVTYTCTAFNCSANPYIYICVGRWKKQSCRGSLKQAFEKVFKDTETSQQEEATTTSNTHATEH